MRFLRRIASFVANALARLFPQAIHKPLLFGFYGALGCLLGAIIGEGLLAATYREPPPPPPAQPKQVCLVMDCSGSMQGSKLDEMKQAAERMVQQHDLTKDALSLVSFSTTASIVVPLTQDVSGLVKGIRSLQVDGSTAMHHGIGAARTALQGSGAVDKWILLFTDGSPDSQADAEAQANLATKEGIRMVAVATGDADAGNLRRLVGNPHLVFWASAGQFDLAFSKAGAAMSRQGLIESRTGATGSIWAMLRICGWTALLAVGLSLFLIAGQNRYLRRPFLRRREALRGSAGSLAAGLIAGALGQTLYLLGGTELMWAILTWIVFGMALAVLFSLSLGIRTRQGAARAAFIGTVAGVAGWGTHFAMMGPSPNPAESTGLGMAIAALIGAILAIILNRSKKRLTFKSAAFRGAMTGLALAIGVLVTGSFAGQYDQEITSILSRMIGWCVLGMLVGLSMSFFVANLGARRALLGGAVGGAAGAAGFFLAGAWAGDIAGRMIGAAILGFCIGLMIALAELVFREAWLEVIYGPNETRNVSIGHEPVSIGSDGEACTVYAVKAPPVALRYRLDQGQIVCEDVPRGRTYTVSPGDLKLAGAVTVAVRAIDPSVN